MHSRVGFATCYKVIIFIPTVLAPATMAPVFRLIFDADGQFNGSCAASGSAASPEPWLADADTAMAVVMLDHDLAVDRPVRSSSSTPR